MASQPANDNPIEIPAPVRIWTDGGCKPNPGIGGWAAIIKYPDREIRLTGNNPETTNNQMELGAAIAVLESVIEPSNIHFHTDSQYISNGMMLWRYKWEQRGWRKSTGEHVPNADLWQRLIAASKPHNIKWIWVRGHNGNEMNEKVDFLATMAREALEAENTLKKNHAKPATSQSNQFSP